MESDAGMRMLAAALACLVVAVLVGVVALAILGNRYAWARRWFAVEDDATMSTEWIGEQSGDVKPRARR